MVVFLLFLFWLSSSIVHAYDIQSIIHTADTVKAKCDSLPYRTIYFDRACYFAILLAEEKTMSQARNECKSVLPLSDITKPSADIAQMMFLELSNFLVDESSVGPNKIALCTTDRPLQCPTGEGYDQAGRRCMLRAPTKMTYTDAVYFCASRGTQLPVVRNVLEKTQFLELVRSGPIWLEVTASRNGWSGNNEFSWHTTCAVDSLIPPRDRSAFCDAKFAQVLSKDAHTSVSEQSNLMDVVCTRESSSEFWIPPELPMPLTTRRTSYWPTTHTSPKPNDPCPLGYNGRWSEWTTIGKCSTTCGSCNVAKRKRVCNTTCGCCKGEASDIGPCGIALCPFPTNTCCFKYVKSLNYRANSFFCGASSARLYPEGCGPLPDEPRHEPVQSQPVTVETPVIKDDCSRRADFWISIWSEWTVVGHCPTTCGSCSTAKRTRVCDPRCACCKGPAEDIGPCGIAVCMYPSKQCCFDYKRAINGNTNQFFCGTGNVAANPIGQCNIEDRNKPRKPPQPKPEPAKPTPEVYKPPKSCWSEWSNWTGDCNRDPSFYDKSMSRSSSGPCGWCGQHTRTRTRLTTPCNGDVTQTEPCGSAKLCTFPTRTCCKPYQKSLVENRLICA